MDAKFRVDDRVRFIGTDVIHAVRQYNAETLQYEVQSGESNCEWVEERYLELVESAAPENEAGPAQRVAEWTKLK